MTDKQDIIQTVVDRAAIMAKEPVSLDSQELTDADMPGLVAALQGCPAGTVVYLTNNQIGPQGAQILADLVETNPNIGGLILMGNPIGDDGAMAIVSALHPNSNLCTLIVMDCGLSDEGVRALDDAMVRISPKNMVGYLADGEKSTELQGLLDENNEVDNWVEELADDEEKPEIATLCLVADRLVTLPHQDLVPADRQRVYDLLEAMPKLDYEGTEPIKKKHLLQKNDAQLTPLDNPQTWQQIEALAPRFKTPLTKEFLLTTINRDGDPIICNAIRSGAMEAIVPILNAQGERLEAADITPEIEAAFYDAPVSQSRALFTDVQFEGKTATDMREMVAAINIELECITNFHQLSSHLKREQQQARRLGGIEA